MGDQLSHGHYVLGIEGLALLRAGARRSYGSVGARTREIGEVLSALDSEPYSLRRDLPSEDPDAGYAGWAASYDDPGNDTIDAEQHVVWPLLDELPDGPVLDAACGTGRHSSYLVERGRADVIGVDSSEAMLDRARAKLPGLDVRVGSLDSLPLDDASVAGAVCALALSHLPSIDAAVAELARVLRPGGHLVISNPHPFATGIMGWRAVYTDAAGMRREIPEYAHLHADYVRAFSAAGLKVRTLIEPTLSAAAARARAKRGNEDAFEDALTGLPVVIVWEAEKA